MKKVNWAAWERHGPDLVWPYWENRGGDYPYYVKIDDPVEEVAYDEAMRQLEADQLAYEKILGWFCGGCGLHGYGDCQDCS